MSTGQQPHRTRSHNLVHPLYGRSPPDLLVPVGVTYDSIITNPDELITIENMLRLLRSISPKLDYVYELVEFSTYKECREIKEMVLLMRDRTHDECVSSMEFRMDMDTVEGTLEETYVECKALLQTIKGTLPALRMTSHKTAEKLEAHIMANGEIDLLKLLFVHRDFIATVFELFRQVDECEQKTIEAFERVSASRKSLMHKFEVMLNEIDLLFTTDFLDKSDRSNLSSKHQQDHNMTDICEGEIDSIEEYVDYIKEYL